MQLSGFLALDAIFLGNINLGQTKSHQVMADLDTRYGLTDRMSVDVDVPYIYRHSDFIVGGAGGAANSLSDASVNSSAIGDVNFGIYYQFLKETNNLPDVVGSLRVKAPTGTSPFGIKLVQRVARGGLWRLLPAIGALAVAAYAYYDTEQVGQTAIEFFRKDIELK